ncbi:MAG: hypothetical protein QXT73_06965 [Candidatus Methanomethylicaceae archaeon]
MFDVEGIGGFEEQVDGVVSIRVMSFEHEASLEEVGEAGVWGPASVEGPHDEVEFFGEAEGVEEIEVVDSHGVSSIIEFFPQVDEFAAEVNEADILSGGV